MTLRVNRSVVAGDLTASFDIEVSGVDESMLSRPGLYFDFLALLIDKVFSDSNGLEIREVPE
jgi:hypothetical protein